MSDSNYTRLGYVAESTFGTTPSSALQLLRRTGGAITPKSSVATSQEIQSNLRPGKPVRTEEWCEGSINLEWSARSLDDIIAQMLMSTWTSSIIVDGTTQSSLTIEDQFIDTDVSPNQYMVYKGCRVGSLSMVMNVGSIVTGSFGVVGKSATVAQASAGTGNTAAKTTGPLNAVDMVTTLNEGAGTALGQVTSVTLNLQRDLRRQHAIGARNPWNIGVGRLMVTGSIKQYFRDAVLLNAWSAFTDRALAVTLNDGTDSISIDIPKMRYIGDPVIDIPGPDSDCYVTVNFQAYALVSDSYMIKLTRTYP